MERRSGVLGKLDVLPKGKMLKDGRPGKAQWVVS